MIRISADALRLVQAHAERDYPEECCGMMLGTDRPGGLRVIQEVLPIENVQEDNRRRRFLITPGQYLEAERAAAGRGLSLLGFYHSHPDHPARPSAFDTEHALPWFSYVIAAVAGGRLERLTAWELREDRTAFRERSVALDGAPADVGR